MADGGTIETARILRIDESAYHADPAPQPSLSASIAKVMLDSSPAHAWHAHPRLGGGARREATDSMDRGSLIHKLVLGAGADLAIVAADDWRTKAAREERDAARSAGRIPVLSHAHADALNAASAIKRGLRDVGVTLDGESELSFVWREFVNGAPPVWCRGRADHVLRSGTIYDLKTTGKGAHPRMLARRVIDSGYDVQRAAYVSGLSSIWPDLAGRIDFVFLFAETEPPYAVTACRLDGMLREHGERRWRAAVDRWAACMRDNEWPGYASEIVTLESPGWLLATMEEVA